jgi:hypothetical protein
VSYRISSIHKVFIRSWLGACVLFVSGCAQAPANVRPPVLPTCVSPATETNPYLSQPPAGALTIYTSLKNGTVIIDEARKWAFSQLGKNTDHWSQYVDIAIDGTRMVRITVTYLDPVLVQYIFLNHLLSLNVNEVAGVTTDAVANFNSELISKMGRVADRKEMLFLITITAPAYDRQAYDEGMFTVKIPVEQMALINGSDLMIYPTHEDHILDETIYITRGPVSGIVGYPLSVIVGENCTWVIDTYTTTLTLDMPTVTLGSETFGPQYWSIPYQPLIPTDFNVSSSTYDSNYDMSRISPLLEPPKPYWAPGTVDPTVWKVYWEDMGRYIWNLVITETHH